MIWNFKQEKPQRQRRRSTHDVTESISTFVRRRKLQRCQTPWVRFNIEPSGVAKGVPGGAHATPEKKICCAQMRSVLCIKMHEKIF